MAVDPKTPLRADWRFLQQLLNTVLSDKVEHVPAEYSMLGRFFLLAGGSWEKVFRGDPAQVELLKRILKAAHKRHLLTRKYKWAR